MTAILFSPNEDGKSQPPHQNKNLGLWKQPQMGTKLQCT